MPLATLSPGRGLEAAILKVLAGRIHRQN